MVNCKSPLGTHSVLVMSLSI
uniref:Uncharacterized protein n=1 Tax=Anguilla anguilla TaxID=7936 RepID=A0A0E9SY59_ANGAN